MEDEGDQLTQLASAESPWAVLLPAAGSREDESTRLELCNVLSKGRVGSVVERVSSLQLRVDAGTRSPCLSTALG